MKLRQALCPLTLSLALLGACATGPAPAPAVKPTPKPTVAKKRAPAPVVVRKAFPKRTQAPPTFNAVRRGVVFMVAGISGLDAVATKAEAFGRAVSNRMPVGVAAPMMRRMLSQAAKLQDVDWMAPNQPAYMMAVMGKRQPSPVLLLPMSNRADALKSGRGEALQETHGHAAAYRNGKRVTYLSTVGQYLVVTQQREIAAAYAGAIQKLTRWQPSAEISLVIPLVGVMKVFAPQVQGMLQMLSRQAKSAGPAGMMGILGFLVKVASQTEQIAVDLHILTNSLKISGEVKPLASSDFRKFVGKISGRRALLGTTIPSNAWFTLLSSFDPNESPAYRKIGSSMSSILTTFTYGGSGPGSQLTRLFQAISDQYGPQSSGAAYSDKGFPLAFHYVGVVKDGPKLRKLTWKLIQTMGHLLIAKGGIKLKKKLKKKKFKLPKKITTKTLAKALSRALKKRGISVKGKTMKKGTTQVDTLTFRIGDPLLKRFKALLGPVKGQLQLAIATSKDRVAVAFGPTASARALAVVKGTKLGAGPKHGAAKGHLMSFSVKLGAVMREVMKFGLVKSRMAAMLLSQVRGDLSFVLSTDGRALRAETVVPGALGMMFFLANSRP